MSQWLAAEYTEHTAGLIVASVHPLYVQQRRSTLGTSKNNASGCAWNSKATDTLHAAMWYQSHQQGCSGHYVQLAQHADVQPGVHAVNVPTHELHCMNIGSRGCHRALSI